MRLFVKNNASRPVARGGYTVPPDGKWHELDIPEYRMREINSSRHLAVRDPSRMVETDEGWQPKEEPEGKEEGEATTPTTEMGDTIVNSGAEKKVGDDDNDEATPGVSPGTGPVTNAEADPDAEVDPNAENDPEAEPPARVSDQDLEGLNKKELRNVARDRGVPLPPKATVAQIIEAIQSHEE